jgi:hypothetical protein
MPDISGLGADREQTAVTDTLAKHQFRVGDEIVCLGWPPSPPLTVTDTSDASLLTCELPSGCTVRVGRAACEIVKPTIEDKHGN